MSDTTIPLLDPASGETIRQIKVAPGQNIVPLDKDPVEPPRMAFLDWVPVGEGAYRPVARVHGRMVRVTCNNIDRLGFGVSVQTLRRLILAGFVRGAVPSPYVTLVDLSSWEEHLRACTEDLEFWDHPGRRSRYIDIVRGQNGGEK